MSLPNHITYHPEGRRAFLLEDDGTTICEVVVPGQNDAVPVAAELASAYNLSRKLLETCRGAVLALAAAAERDLAFQRDYEAVSAAIADATWLEAA